MARAKKPDEPVDDVPAWVMTFSDVITLLMTFFILLLTFASNESETFERMQVSMFGGGGATGFVGTAEGMDQNALQMRQRSRAGRIAPDGSEMPPIYSDPALSTLDKGISGLQEEEQRVLSTEHDIRQSLDKMVDAKGNLTNLGKQQLKLLSRQMRKRPLRLEFVVHKQEDIPSALSLTEHLEASGGIHPAQIGISIAPHRIDEGKVLIIIANQGVSRGTEDKAARSAAE